jgi:integration host factor subunit alpha
MTDHFQDAQTSETVRPPELRGGYRTRLDSHRTVTRADLAESLRRTIGLSYVESAEFVEMVLQEILDTIASGEDVKLSSFGSFVVRAKRERVGRNPRTGEEAKIVARRVVIFRASNVLRARINTQHADDEQVLERNAAS